MNVLQPISLQINVRKVYSFSNDVNDIAMNNNRTFVYWVSMQRVSESCLFRTGICCEIKDEQLKFRLSVE